MKDNEWNMTIPAKTLLNVINIAGSITDEVLCEGQEGGLLLNAVDAAHVSMFNMVVGLYDEKKPSVRFGIELKGMHDAVSGFTKANKTDTDYVNLAKEASNEMLTMKMGTGTGVSHPDEWETEVKLRCLDAHMLRKVTIPELNTSVEAENISGDKLAFALKKQKRFGDIAKFVLSKDKLEITTAMSDRTIASTIDAETSTKKTIEATYSLSYLQPMAERIKKAANLTLKFDNNYPLWINWNEKSPWNMGTEVSLDFVQAPKIDNEY